MRDGRVGHHFFGIFLHPGGKCSVDDPHYAEAYYKGGTLSQCVGKERNGKTQQSIGTHFEQYSGKYHRTRSGRLSMGMRQPGMKGPKRYFDRKGEQKCTKEVDFPRQSSVGKTV